jgi:hypothetical protein
MDSWLRMPRLRFCTSCNSSSWASMPGDAKLTGGRD